MVAHYITTKPIMDLCEGVVRRMGTWVSKQWQEQEGLDMEGEWVAVQAADEGYPEESDGEAEGVAVK